MKNIEQFLRKLASVRLPGVFNPYSQRCPIHDTPDAPQIRLANLRIFLSAVAESGIDEIWMARDLGYRGGRRTGVALTDEVHLGLLNKLCSTNALRRATIGEVVSERTATVVWDVILEVGRTPFLWNAFPFHPFEPADPMSNRSHTRRELDQVWGINEMLFELLQPRRFVAIGNDAANALARQGVPCEYVRHPSYGGQSDFKAGIRRLYGLRDELDDCTDSAASGQYVLAL